MPFTLPAHAAAVLPLSRWAPGRLHPLALVVGACTPDLVYAFGIASLQAHHPRQLLPVCLPVGLVWFAWAQWLVLPSLAGRIRPLFGVDWPRLFGSSQAPQTAKDWLPVLVGILIGSLTHLVWDGFTHASSWPASALYGQLPIEVLGRSVHLAVWLWWGSTLVGTGLVVAFLVQRFPAAGGTKPPPSPLWLGALLFWTVGWVALGLTGWLPAPSGRLRTDWLWSNAGVVGARAALVSLTVWCLAERFFSAGWKRGEALRAPIE